MSNVFDLAEFKPEVGFEFQFYGGHEDVIQYQHVCVITEMVAGKKITYSWRYEGYEGISYVTFELFPEGSRTKLKLTHTGLESFPVSNPDLAAANFAEGWTSIIGTVLRNIWRKNKYSFLECCKFRIFRILFVLFCV